MRFPFPALAALALARAALAADPAPPPPDDVVEPERALPSRGVLIGDEPAGVTLEGKPLRSREGRPAPACGVVTSATALEGGERLAAGEAVAILSVRRAGWTRVHTASGAFRFVPADAVRVAPSEGCSPLAATPSSLRRRASPSAEVVARLPPGTSVAFGTVSAPGWLLVRADGGETGYVPADSVVADSGKDPPERRALIALSAGVLSPIAGELEAWGRSVSIELGVGARVSEHLRVEGAAGWQALSADRGAAFGGGALRGGRLRLVPLVARLRLLARAGEAELSAFAGVGAGFVSWRATPDEPPVEERGSDTAVLGEAGLGLALPVGARMWLGLELRERFGSARVAGKDVKLDAASVIAGLAWEL